MQLLSARAGLQLQEWFPNPADPMLVPRRNAYRRRKGGRLMTLGIHELRRQNLARLVFQEGGEGRGSQMKAADKFGLTEQELSHYLNKHKKMGGRKARQIEEKLGLPENFLDSHGLSDETLQIARLIELLPEADRLRVRDLVSRLKK